LDFRLDLDAVAAALDAVERRCWLFENMPLDPLHRDWLRERAWVRTVHGTTRIEGNTLNGLEVEQLKDVSFERALG
jgi:hypothetical protein